MRKSIYFFLWLLIGILIGEILFSFIHGYKDSILFFVNVIGQDAYADKILSLVTASKFLILQILIFTVCIALLFIVLKLDSIIAYVTLCWSYWKEAIKMFWADIIHTKVFIVICLPFISAMFFLFYMPVSYDEASTYLNFTSKSVIASLCYYPAPNNHVLHSLITNVTKYIPFLSALFCLRISSVIVSVITWLLCFSFIQKYYSEKISLVITGIASMLFMTIYYSYMSRGYGLVMLFFIVGLYSSYNIIKKGDKNTYWICFSISNILGFFTMPSFLYPFIILNSIIVVNHRFNIRKQVIYTTMTVVAVIGLYTPIIIVNGLSALISNRFVVPVDRKEVLETILPFFKNVLSEITGVDYIYVVVLLGLSVIMLLKNKMRFELGLMLMFLLLPFVLLIGHSVIPFSRTFNYYAFVLVFLICIPYWRLLEKIPVVYVISFVLLIQILCLTNFCMKIKKYESFNVTYHEINNNIVGNNSYYFSARFFESNFLFENKTKGFDIKKAEYHFPPVNVSADTLKGFDYYIIDRENDFTNVKKPRYSDEYTNVYGK